jgi:hypothetical protein
LASLPLDDDFDSDDDEEDFDSDDDEEDFDSDDEDDEDSELLEAVFDDEPRLSVL